MDPLEEIAQSRPEGLALPPLAIRDIVEKTAAYVVRNGIAFEDRVRQQSQAKLNFSFLNHGDQFRPYYEWRMKELSEGFVVGSKSRSPKGPPKPKGPPEPPQYQFSARMPNISAKDLQVLRKTAEFVAANGRAFMTELSRRESNNPQFDFLRPQHSLHSFFSRMVDQYKDLRAAKLENDGKLEEEVTAKLMEDYKNQFKIVDRAKERAAWKRHQEKTKAETEEKKKQEDLEYAQVDWHEFSVVETVVFDDRDDEMDLPEPITLNDLQSVSLDDKAKMSMTVSSRRIEEAVPGEEVYQNYYPPTHPPPFAIPQDPYGRPPSVASYPPPGMPRDEEEEQRIRERQEARERAQRAQAAAKGTGPIRLRNDYVPRVAKRKTETMLCPQCNLEIPVEEMQEHMRVELLNPNWKDQKAKEAAHRATTNLSTNEVANNLKRLASQRSDVFDTVVVDPITEEEQARRKKAALSYDGQLTAQNTAKLQHMQAMNVSDQIKSIHEKFGNKNQDGSKENEKS
ncbi:hypothetical protein K402DRAFT_255493 [Aulographum hederae CBS 113979]|uniref:SURP motif domain-containing protein n=1 Tax=Aulographum hederae CBS 113979 TaxID=1176131 RepID=A0A6G1GJ11_9PEZI|nr:hypothetical protein K402DRAFT_255493 [Aulographum hederae CBS 113979]